MERKTCHQMVSRPKCVTRKCPSKYFIDMAKEEKKDIVEGVQQHPHIFSPPCGEIFDCTEAKII